MERAIEKTKKGKESAGQYGALSTNEVDEVVEEDSSEQKPSKKLVRRITHRRSIAHKLVKRRSVDGFYHGQPDEDDEVDLNGAGNTIFLMVNTMIGAGILNMPEVFAHAGIGLGLAMFALTMWANWMGLVMLVRVGEAVGVLDYGALAEQMFGTRGKFAVDGMIVASGYGALLSYFITIGNLGSQVVQLYAGDSFYTSYHFILSTVTLFVILPICMIREFGHLVWISILSVLAITGVILLVVFHGPAGETHHTLPIIRDSSHVAHHTLPIIRCPSYVPHHKRLFFAQRHCSSLTHLKLGSHWVPSLLPLTSSGLDRRGDSASLGPSLLRWVARTAPSTPTARYRNRWEAHVGAHKRTQAHTSARE
jgi:hypothetical protein